MSEQESLENLYLWAYAAMVHICNAKPPFGDTCTKEQLYSECVSMAAVLLRGVPPSEALAAVERPDASVTVKLSYLYDVLASIAKAYKLALPPTPSLLAPCLMVTEASEERTCGLKSAVVSVQLVFGNSGLLREISKFGCVLNLETSCHAIKEAAYGAVLYHMRHISRVLFGGSKRKLILRRVANLQKQMSVRTSEIFYVLNVMHWKRIEGFYSVHVIDRGDFILCNKLIWTSIHQLTLHTKCIEQGWINNLVNLRVLTIRGRQDVLNLLGVERVPLEVLDLKDAAIQDVVLPSTTSRVVFSALRELRVGIIPIGCLKRFGTLPRLETLELRSAAGLGIRQFIHDCSNVKRVVMDRAPRLRICNALAWFPKLRELVVNDAMLHCLPDLPSVKSLTIYTSKTPSFYCDLWAVNRKFEALESLHLNFVEIRNLAPLRSLARLRFLTLTESLSCPYAIPGLKDLLSLEVLVFGCTEFNYVLSELPPTLNEVWGPKEQKCRDAFIELKRQRPDITFGFLANFRRLPPDDHSDAMVTSD